MHLRQVAQRSQEVGLRLIGLVHHGFSKSFTRDALPTSWRAAGDCVACNPHIVKARHLRRSASNPDAHGVPDARIRQEPERSPPPPQGPAAKTSGCPARHPPRRHDAEQQELFVATWSLRVAAGEVRRAGLRTGDDGVCADDCRRAARVAAARPVDPRPVPRARPGRACGTRWRDRAATSDEGVPRTPACFRPAAHRPARRTAARSAAR